jgi:hypothetical protein
VVRCWASNHRGRYSSFRDGVVRRQDGLMERLARWRIRMGDYRLPLDLKMYHVLAKVLGWGAEKTRARKRWIEAADVDSPA